MLPTICRRCIFPSAEESKKHSFRESTGLRLPYLEEETVDIHHIYDFMGHGIGVEGFQDSFLLPVHPHAAASGVSVIFECVGC